MQIAILGAERSGKGQLAHDLRLALETRYPTLILLPACAFLLMQAVYRDVLQGDASLYPQALQQQRGVALTLVTGLDWPPGGAALEAAVQRRRAQVDQRLRGVLQQHGLAYATVHGTAAARCQAAQQALAHAQGVQRSQPGPTDWAWACEKCSDPQCEHRLFSALVGRR